MTTTRADILITGDLAALADDSRADLVPLADSLPAGVYRDDRPGAAARRDALLDERRRELAVMPLALSHVFAHRVGRAAAGAAALASTAVVAVVLADPLLARIAAWAIPGLNVPLVVALVGTAILAAYVIGSWVAERVYARRMRDAISTTGHAYPDLEHLAAGPVDVGRRLVRSADRWAVTLSVAGVAAVVPVLGFVVFAIGAAYQYPMAWSNMVVIANGGVADGLGPMVVATVLAVIGAVALGRACDRELRRAELPRWAAALAHWAMIPLGLVLVLAGMYGALRVIHHHQLFGIPPDGGELLALAVAGVLGVFALAAWTALWWRRREHARIGG